ncbi:hypothetical protein PYCC9005_004142 [Savitreella phatthalungensis]
MCCCEDPDLDETPVGRGVEPARWPAKSADKNNQTTDEVIDDGYLLYRRRTWIYVMQAVSASLSTASVVWLSLVALDILSPIPITSLSRTGINANGIVKKARREVWLTLGSISLIGGFSCAWVVHFFGSIAERDDLWKTQRKIFFLWAHFILEVFQAIAHAIAWIVGQINILRDARIARKERKEQSPARHADDTDMKDAIHIKTETKVEEKEHTTDQRLQDTIHVKQEE